MPKPPALFQAEGSLTQEDCGAFWKQFIAQLPPYYDETQPAFENGDLDICLPLCVSGGYGGRHPGALRKPLYARIRLG